jgi:hypothetical protein
MIASAKPLPSPASAAPPAVGAAGGSVTGGVRLLLRLEGLAALAASLALYAQCGFSWPLFALLFLAPDLAMLGYFAGPRIGAAAYNLVHTYALALPLAAAGFFIGIPALMAAALILIAHIGFDRLLGFGLKYSTAFGDTHLGNGDRR